MGGSSLHFVPLKMTSRLLLNLLRPLKPRFDYLVDELDPLLIRNKRALHCVQRQFLEIMESEVKGVGGQFILPGEIRFAHEPIIRIERDTEAIAMKNSERVFLDTLHGARIHIAGQA